VDERNWEEGKREGKNRQDQMLGLFFLFIWFWHFQTALAFSRDQLLLAHQARIPIPKEDLRPQ
jgi:hypothetical protein